MISKAKQKPNKQAINKPSGRCVIVCTASGKIVYEAGCIPEDKKKGTRK